MHAVRIFNEEENETAPPPQEADEALAPHAEAEVA